MLDQLERDYQTRALAAAIAQAAGQPVTVPTWGEIREKFDTALAAPPEDDDSTDPELVLLRALGLR